MSFDNEQNGYAYQYMFCNIQLNGHPNIKMSFNS